MKRTSTIATLAALCLIALAGGRALADDTATPQPGAAQPGTAQPGTVPDNQTPSAQPAPSTQPPPATTPAPADPPTMGGDAGAPPAPSAADALTRIRDEGKKVDAKADQKATTALDAASNDVEKNVTSDGDAKVAERLAAEFGSTPDALLSEKNDLKTSWGQLMIAHSLLANGTTDLTAKQIFDLRGEGMSWGQIANGMGLRLGEVVKAAKEEARVAKGLSKPDGKVAVVHGAGSKFGATGGPTKTEKTAMKAASKAETAKADAAKAPESAGDTGGTK